MPNATPTSHRLRVFIDADVLFAGAASPSEHGASLVILRMAEITLLDAVASQQVVSEAERNLAAKIPDALPAFRLLASRCLRFVSDPEPPELTHWAGLADDKDLPILVAAAREQCTWLVTHNVRHFQPGHSSIAVLRPGEFLWRVREQLASLSLFGQRN
ncbi:MAG TPA: PIN domain-containing protein [Anaerolineae bacterium]|nr:PIN domain-containing protein [Anaerolineae bacterium]